MMPSSVVAATCAIVVMLMIATVTAAIVPIGAPRSPSFSSSSSLSHGGNDLAPCLQDTVVNITATTGTFGCSTWDKVRTKTITIVYDLSTNVSRMLNIAMSSSSTRLAVTVLEDNVIIAKSEVGVIFNITLAAGASSQQVVLTLKPDPAFPQSRDTFVVTITPVTVPLYHIVSNQTLMVEQQIQGGFVYFALPWYNYGRLFDFHLTIYDYQGMKNPAIIARIGDLPTLEQYDLINMTAINIDGHVHCWLNRWQPKDGRYFVGVFLYGTTARISVTPIWNFNIQELVNGVAVESKTAHRETVFYSATVPINTPQLRFQFSRQIPGGHPIARIGQGTPVIANYQWIADTSIQSYYSFIIPNPYPSSNATASGVYLVQVGAPPSTPPEDSYGWMVQADW